MKNFRNSNQIYATLQNLFLFMNNYSLGFIPGTTYERLVLDPVHSKDDIGMLDPMNEENPLRFSIGPTYVIASPQIESRLTDNMRMTRRTILQHTPCLIFPHMSEDLAALRIPASTYPDSEFPFWEIKSTGIGYFKLKSGILANIEKNPNLDMQSVLTQYIEEHAEMFGLSHRENDPQALAVTPERLAETYLKLHQSTARYGESHLHYDILRNAELPIDKLLPPPFTSWQKVA